MSKTPILSHYPKEIDWHASLTGKPVYELLDQAAKKFPDHVVIDFLGACTKYSELLSMANCVAKGLQELGIKKGTKIGLFLPNCPYFPIFYYGALKTGATVVNFNPLYSHNEVKHQITDSDTDFMVTLDVKLLYDKLMPMLDETRLKKIIVCPMTSCLPFPKNFLYPIIKRKEVATIPHADHTIFYDDLIKNDGNFNAVDINPDEDVALLQYTGGTTGVPKGAMLTHSNLTINTQQARLWGFTLLEGEESFLAILPFFHVFAMTAILNFAIAIGGKILAMPKFDLNDTMKIIDKKKPTVFSAVPTIYAAISNHKDRKKYDLSSIKFCISGGAPLPADVRENFEKASGCTLVEGYGLTESSPVAVCNPPVGTNKAGSIGLPLPGTTIDIISTDDGTTVMPQGEKGEICITGPQVMKGYYNKGKETKETIKQGRLHTGDVGYIDEEGYIFIVDRIKDLIIAGGYNIYPRNVEEAIYKHPAVEECICAGVPDKYRGETVKVWIKLHDGQSLTKEELNEFLKKHLSPMERPKIVEFRDKPLPKTMVGKLSRKDILAEEAEKKEA